MHLDLCLWYYKTNTNSIIWMHSSIVNKSRQYSSIYLYFWLRQIFLREYFRKLDVTEILIVRSIRFLEMNASAPLSTFRTESSFIKQLYLFYSNFMRYYRIHLQLNYTRYNTCSFFNAVSLKFLWRQGCYFYIFWTSFQYLLKTRSKLFFSREFSVKWVYLHFGCVESAKVIWSDSWMIENGVKHKNPWVTTESDSIRLILKTCEYKIKINAGATALI